MAWKLVNKHNRYYEYKFRGPIDIASSWVETERDDSLVHGNPKPKITEVHLNISNTNFVWRAKHNWNKETSTKVFNAKALKFQKRMMKQAELFITGKKDWFKVVEVFNKAELKE